MVLARTPYLSTPLQLVFASNDDIRERTISTNGQAVVVLHDVLVSIFGYPPDASVSGVLMLPNAAEGTWALARTYTESPQGSYGQEFPLLFPGMGSGVGFGEQGVLPILLQDANFRTNLGLVNVSGTGLEARVRIYSASGQEAGTRRFLLGPWQRVQANEILSSFGLNVGYAVVETLTPDAYLWAYASMVDNHTNDPTTLPMWRVQR